MAPSASLKGGLLKTLITEVAGRLGLASRVSIREDGSNLLVTVTCAPNAVTRSVPSGPRNEDTLAELTLLLMEMSRHVDALTPAKREHKARRHRSA